MDDVDLQRELRERLINAGVDNVIGVVAPLFFDSSWTLYLENTDRMVEARAALAAIPGVADISQTGRAAVVTFTFDRFTGTPAAPGSNPWTTPAPSSPWQTGPAPSSN